MLSIKNLSKHYKDGKGIDDINFEIKNKEIVGFVGENGAGKTTTIKCIFNELKKDSGSITYDGENVNNNLVMKKFSFFPDANNVPMDLTVVDLMNYVGRLSGLDEKEILKREEELIQTFDLEKHKFKKVSELSAGLKKRAIMAYCLLTRPDVFILDEPTANLDVEYRLDFISLLKELNNLGVTIFITSHNLEELQEIINHLIIIKDGKIVHDRKFDNKKDSIAKIYKSLFLKEKMNFVNIKDIYNEK